jgi:hypothetical protein
VYYHCAISGWETINIGTNNTPFLNAQSIIYHSGSQTSEIVSPPTHTSTGLQNYVCGSCGEIQTQIIEKLPEHDWNNAVVTIVNPTHTTEGAKIFTCICGESYSEPIATLTEHTYDWFEYYDEEQHKMICACGAEQYADHDYHIAAYWSPDEYQHMVACDCGYERCVEHTYEISKDSYSNWEHWAICECEYGTYFAHTYQYDIYEDYHIAACECGYEMTHSWSYSEITTEPTVDTEGVRTHYCNECEATRTEAIEKLPDPDTTVEEELAPGFFQKLLGCNSTLAGSACTMLIISLAGACLISKKKED